MKKLRFKATTSMRSYHSVPVWHNGDEHEVGAVEAERLLRDFPLNFVEIVPPKPEPVKVEPVEEKAIEAAPNKAAPIGKNKGKWN